MKERVNCELLASAKKLASRKGLPVKEVVCFEDTVCPGTVCLVANLGFREAQENTFTRVSQVEVFNARYARKT